MKIKKNCVATINYTLTNDKGEVIDTSKDGPPLAYIQGAGLLIPGLENELENKQKGDSFKVTVPPEEGYGKRHDQLVQVLDKGQFDHDGQLELGMQFEAQTPQGPMTFNIIDISGDKVKVDANHPLADQILHFDVEILDVRDANKEELDHGHVHGEHGHQH